MKKFYIGDRVIVIEDNEVKKGTIKNIHYDLEIVIVEFDDGSVEKALIENIALEPKAETKADPESQEKYEDAPRMRSEITITWDEFKVTSARILAEETKDHAIVGVAFIPILTKIAEALFYEKESENSDNVE